MRWLKVFINSSIVKKQLMAITGLLLTGFLISHMTGNFLLVCSPKAFNIYAHTLISNPLIYLAEAILALIFLAHMATALRLTVQNHQARPEKYYLKVKTGRGATFASSTMIYTGFVILAFLIYHINHFKFGDVYLVTYDGEEIRDLYKTVAIYFQEPLHVLIYVVAMGCIGIHLAHGFQSAFQSLGFNHAKYSPGIDKVGYLLAALFTVGFSFLAIWCHFQGGAYVG